MPATVSKRDARAIVERELRLVLSTATTHFANVNAAKDVWWLDVPVDKFTSGNNSTIDLLLVSSDAEQLHYLKVPTAYFRDNLSRFYARSDTNCVSLELSSQSADTFHDVRPGSVGTPFGQFLVKTLTLSGSKKPQIGQPPRHSTGEMLRTSRARPSTPRQAISTVRSLARHSTTATDHSLLSSYREMLLEHLFAGEVMRHVWLSGVKRLEVLKPQVDDGGYDLVLETASVVRHIQLKATYNGSRVRRFNVNTALAAKPSGCVVCLLFDEKTLKLGPFYWFGGAPNEPLPDLSGFPTAKHTKGNAQGVKNPRPNLRVVPLSRFEAVRTVAQLAVKLFGEGVA